MAYHERFFYGARDALVSAALVLTGGVIMFAFWENIYGFLLGTLIIAAGNFAMLVRKYRSGRSVKA